MLVLVLELVADNSAGTGVWHFFPLARPFTARGRRCIDRAFTLTRNEGRAAAHQEFLHDLSERGVEHLVSTEPDSIPFDPADEDRLVAEVTNMYRSVAGGM